MLQLYLKVFQGKHVGNWNQHCSKKININGAQPSLESTAISPGILRNRSQKIRCRVNNGWEDKKHKTFARRPAPSGSIVQCGSAKHNGCDCYRCCAAAMFEEFVWRIDTLKTQERNHHHEKEETCPDERSFWLLNHAVGDGHVTGCEKALFENFKVGIKKYQEPSCMFICHQRHHLIHHLIVRPEVQLFGCSSGSKTLLGGQSHVERRDRWDRLPPGSKLPGCILHFYIFLQYFTSQSSQVSGGSLSLSLSLSLSDSLNLLCFSVLLCSGFSNDLEDLDLSCTAPWGSIVEASVDQLRDILWRNQPLYGSMALCLITFVSKRFCQQAFWVSEIMCLQRVFNVFWECVLTCFVFFCPSRVLMRAVGSVCRMSCICPKSASAQSWRLHESSWFHPLSSAPLSSIDM